MDRTWKRLFITLLLSAFGVAQDAESSSLAYVTNSGSDTVSVIDTATNSVIATIPVGNQPSGIAVSPAGTVAYVSNYGSGTVSVINTVTQAVVATIPVSGAPVGVVFTPDGRFAYVASCNTGVVSAIDTATHAVVATVGGFAFGALANNPPGGLAVTPDGAYVLVPNVQGTLYWIATSTNTVVATLELPVFNEGYVTVTPDGRYAYVDGYYGYITKVDLATRTVVQSFSVTGGAAGPALWQTAVSGDGATLYAVSGGFNQVYVIDTGSTQTLTTIAVGAAPRGLALKTGRAYVTNEGGTTVTVINTVTRTAIGTIGVGLQPFGIAIAEIPDPTLAYVTSSGSDTVSVIDTATNSVIATISVGDRPSGIAVSPAGTVAYVANYGSGTVSAINTVTQAVVATIPVSGAPVGVVFTPDGRFAYVESSGTGVVSAIDTATHAVVATVGGFAFGDLANNPPAGLAVTPDGAYVLVPNVQGTLYWIATSTNTVVATLGLPVFNEGYVTVTPDGRYAYVDGYNGFITKVDLATRAVVQSFSVTGGAPGPALWQTAVSGDGTTLYAVSGGFNQVYVIDTGSTQTLATIAVGAAPRGLALKTGRAYVTNEGGTMVTVINTTTRTVIGTIGVGVQPFGVAIGEIPDWTVLQVEPSAAPYGTVVEVSANLTSVHAGPLPDRAIRFQLASSQYTATTDTDGVARVLIDLAGRPAGAYTLQATFDGERRFQATNGSATLTVTRAIPSVSWSNPASIVYGTPLSGSALNAQADVPGTFSYTPPAGTVLTAGTHRLEARFTPTDGPNYEIRSVYASIDVTPSVPAITFVGPESVVYDGQPQERSVSALGTLGEPLGPVTLSYRLVQSNPLGQSWSPVPPTDAGEYDVRADYAGGVNYLPNTVQGRLIIQRAAATVTVVGGTFTFDGLSHTATAFVTGPGGEDLGTAPIQYDGSSTAPVDAGSYLATATFAQTTNYESATASDSVIITPATATIVVNGGQFVYDGQPHPGSATATGVLGEELAAPAIEYSGGEVPIGAGTHLVIATFGGSRNYQATFGTGVISIAKAPSTVAVSAGTFNYDGQKHAAAATATGVFGEDLGPVSITYNGITTIPINAGTYSVSATFPGNVNYLSASASGTLSIQPGAPTITVIGGVFDYDGLPHAAIGTVVGTDGASLGSLTFTYDGSSAAPIHAGAYAVRASFAGGGNYSDGTASALIRILKIPLIVTTMNANKLYGKPIVAFIASYAGFVGTDTPASLGGSLAFATTAGNASPTGAYTVTPSGLTSPNYAVDFVPGTLTITQAGSLVTLSSTSNPAGYEQPFALTAEVVPTPAGDGVATGTVEFLDGTTGIGSATVSQGAATINIVLDPGTHPITARYLGDANVTGGQSQLDQTVLVRSSSSATSLTIKPGTSRLGDPVTFEVDVRSPAGAPAGSVELRDGAMLLATLALANGSARHTTTSLSTGSHVVVAKYLGDGATGIPPSASSPEIATVLDGASLEKTSVKLSVITKQPSAGDAVDIEIEVSATGSVPGGSVFLSIDGAPGIALVLGEPDRNTSRARGRIESITIGTHLLSAVYPGDGTHAGSTQDIELRIK